MPENADEAFGIAVCQSCLLLCRSPSHARGFLPSKIESLSVIRFLHICMLVDHSVAHLHLSTRGISIWQKAQIKYVLDGVSAPKVMLVMLVYTEPPECLFKALDSFVSCHCPAAYIRVFVSFDGDEADEPYYTSVSG
jgi:hypothetical protein